MKVIIITHIYIWKSADIKEKKEKEETHQRKSSNC